MPVRPFSSAVARCHRCNGAALCIVATVLWAGGQTWDGGSRSVREGAGFRMRVLDGVERDDGDAARGRRSDDAARLDFSHHLKAIFTPELHAEHPEFFPLVAGRRLRPEADSNAWNPDLGRPDVAAFTAEAARRHFAQHPGAGSFSVGVNDGLVFGESEETLAAVAPLRWFRGRPDFSNLVFGFANRVAADLARTHPDKHVGALAYYWAENTPDFPLHPNVAPFLTADRAQGYDRVFREEERALQRRWGRAAKAAGGGPRRLGLYDYLYGSGFLIPRIHTRLLAENLRHAQRAGFTDYYAETYPNRGLDGPMSWLAAQLLRDPEQSSEVLLEGFYVREFGGAAGPMRRFFERCERQWMTQPGAAYWLKHYRNESQARVFPSEVGRVLRGLLDEAGRSARGAGAQARVRLVSDAFGVTERLVALQEARDRLNRAVLGDAADWRAMVEPLRGYVAARREFVEFTTRVRRETPRAIREFEWADYTRHDPLPNAVMTLQAAAVRAGESAAAVRAVRDLGAAQLEACWERAADLSSTGLKPLLRDGVWHEHRQPAREIAGLAYGVSLPEGWLSKVEPSQHQRAEWSAGEPGVLRLSGNKETSIFQWNASGGPDWHVAEIEVRGAVSTSAVVLLSLDWFDAAHRRVGLQTHRLPEGKWPEWVKLRLAAPRPAGARWVGVGLRLQHQMAGDWVDVRRPGLGVIAGRGE